MVVIFKNFREIWDRWPLLSPEKLPADFLAANDSYTFWETVGGLLKPGITGTNVMDVQLLVLRPPNAVAESNRSSTTQ
jgi:MOFRL family